MKAQNRAILVRGRYRIKLDQAGKGRINDIDPGLRILSAYQTPDTVLFQQTAGGEKRELPSGLDLAVALGSGYANELITQSRNNGIPSAIDSLRRIFAPTESLKLDKRYEDNAQVNGDDYCLYQLYLYALRALVDTPLDAPGFMTRDAWKIKSLNALLGSWAQMRYILSLQVKDSFTVFCDETDPSGFAEPNPDFYERMATLARRTALALQSSGAYETDYLEPAESIRAYIHLLGNVKARTSDEYRDEDISISDDEPSN